jgi:hypothetical protein
MNFLGHPSGGAYRRFDSKLGHCLSVLVSVEKEQGPDRSSLRTEESANLVGIVQSTGAGLSLRPLVREFGPVYSGCQNNVPIRIDDN